MQELAIASAVFVVLVLPLVAYVVRKQDAKIETLEAESKVQATDIARLETRVEELDKLHLALSELREVTITRREFEAFAETAAESFREIKEALRER